MAGNNTKHKLKTVEFLGGHKNITLQKVGTQSPLVTVSNLLILSGERVNGFNLFWSATRGESSVPNSLLQEFISRFVEMRLQLTLLVTGGLPQKDVDSCKDLCNSAISDLSTCSNLQPLFNSIGGFEDSAEKCLFDVLGGVVYHGYLIDPEDVPSEVDATKTRAEFIDELNTLKMSDAEGNVHKMSLIEKILSNVSQITSYGLEHLQRDVPEGQLSLLFRNENLAVLYKHKGTLHILVEQEDVLEKHPDAMWKTLDNVGHGRLLTSIFSPINVFWREGAAMLIKEEERAEAKKTKNQLKKDKRKERNRARKAMQEENADSFDRAEDKVTDSPNAGLPYDEPSCSPEDHLTRRFLEFLTQYRIPGCKIPYFSGQVMAMVHIQSFDLEFCYEKLREYSEELAISICNNYYRVAEDLRLSLCNYIYSVIQAEDGIKSKVTQEELCKSTKLKIYCLPERNRFGLYVLSPDD